MWLTISWCLILAALCGCAGQSQVPQAGFAFKQQRGIDTSAIPAIEIADNTQILLFDKDYRRIGTIAAPGGVGGIGRMQCQNLRAIQPYSGVCDAASLQ